MIVRAHASFKLNLSCKYIFIFSLPGIYFSLRILIYIGFSSSSIHLDWSPCPMEIPSGGGNLVAEISNL